MVAHVRTYHNQSADLITRATLAEYQVAMGKLGLAEVDISQTWAELVKRRVGDDLAPLFHLDPEDARVAARLRECRTRRLQPSLPNRFPPLLEVGAGLGHWALAWRALGGQAQVQWYTGCR